MGRSAGSTGRVRTSGCRGAVAGCVLLFVAAVVVGMPAGAAGAEVYHFGVDFISEPYTGSWYYYWVPEGSYSVSPFELTDPGNRFVTHGGLAGWSEEDARRAVALWVGQAFRAVDVGDSSWTVAVMIHPGAVSTDWEGRRLNVAMGRSWDPEKSYGFSDGLDLISDPLRHPNDSYAGMVWTNNLDHLPGDVHYGSSQAVFNSIGGVTAHEIGHFIGLQHVERGTEAIVPIMATSWDGMTYDDYLTVRRFTEEPGSQPNGQSSVQRLVQSVGVVRRADFNMDGWVDMNDAQILLANWQRTDAFFQEGDATGDSFVGLDDGQVLLEQWGASFQSLAGEASMRLDAEGGRLIIDAQAIAWLKLETSDHVLARDGYVPILEHSAVQMPSEAGGWSAGEFSPFGNFISGTGYARLSEFSGTATLWHQAFGGAKQSVTIAIPEPASGVLLAAYGLVGIGLRRRRRFCAT